MTNHKVQEEPVLRVIYFAFHHICLLFGFLFSLPDPPWGGPDPQIYELPKLLRFTLSGDINMFNKFYSNPSKSCKVNCMGAMSICIIHQTFI